MLLLRRSLPLGLLAAVYSHAAPLEKHVYIVPSSSLSPFTGEETYHGTYFNGGNPVSVLMCSRACSHLDNLAESITTPFNGIFGDEAVVWVEEATVEGALRSQEPDFPTALAQFTGALLFPDGQAVMQSSPFQKNLRLLWASDRAALFSLPSKDLGELDYAIPRLWELIRVPFEPLPTVGLFTESDSDKRLREILSKVHFNPDVASVLSSISLARMGFDIRWLTGESTDSPIVSRHSFSDGAITAARWIKGRLEETGASCRFMEFLEGFSPNVICSYAADPSFNKTLPAPRVILSAHYDSRGSFGSTRAPGGDDDGSGVVHLLAIARAIYRRKVTFPIDVELVAFAGEEQGLLGSYAYASMSISTSRGSEIESVYLLEQLYDDGVDIMLQIQADMLAYHDSDEPMQLGLPQRFQFTLSQFL
ncbi:hypothetical protein FRC15_004003 [Serendipita sp. 397]|nr:hypothetical protein FRC15_004003 [Serendipita sp. 397]